MAWRQCQQGENLSFLNTSVKNTAVGFGISFIGSVPLGYLNVVGFELLQSKGFSALIPYLSGVIIEEAIVIYVMLLFAKKLAKGGRFVKILELASIFFMLILAAYFYFRNAGGETAHDPVYLSYPPFVAGFVLNFVNFMQVPFWAGWNLYLIGNKYVDPEGSPRFWYVGGALIGTLAGMLLFILTLNYLAESIEGLQYYLMTIIIPLIFLGLAVFQAWKYYDKYLKSRASA